MDPYLYPSIITLLTIVLFFFISFNVGTARGKYHVKVPHTTGNVEFEKAFRAQQNTLENIIMFLPLLWISSMYLSSLISSIIGIFWLVSRFVYFKAYTSKDPNKRSIPFMVSILCVALLFLGSIVGFFI